MKSSTKKSNMTQRNKTKVNRAHQSKASICDDCSQHKALIITSIIMLGVIIVVATIITAIIIQQTEKTRSSQSNSTSPSIPISTGDNQLNLAEYNSDLEITSAGEYTLSGSLDGYSIIVNAEAEVTLVLENAEIAASSTAAIANISHHTLNVMLADDSINTLKDGGNSDYDAVIYSNGPLTINGNNGTLNIVSQQKDGEGIATKSADLTIDGGQITIVSKDDGLNTGGDGGTITINGGNVTISAGGDGIDSNQNAVFNGGIVYVSGSSAGGDAGIDTDTGYTIHKGTVVALGSDMLEAPDSVSTQRAIAISLGSTYDTGAEIKLVNSAGVAVITCTANESFRTLVLSNEQVVDGQYTLMINEQAVQNIAVTTMITVVGDFNQPR